jgi:hypothetical protein
MITIHLRDIASICEPYTSKGGDGLSSTIHSLTEEQRHDLLSLNAEDLWEITRWGGGSPEAWMEGAVIRSEVGYACSCVGDRDSIEYRHRPSGLALKVILESKEDHCRCNFRRKWLTVSLKRPSWLDERFIKHRLHQMTPFKESPLGEESQALLISEVRQAMEKFLDNKLSGIAFLGPAGTGKTSLISAIMYDRWSVRRTWREVEPEAIGGLSYIERLQIEQRGRPEPELAMWRVNVPDWLEEVNAYDTRPFGKEVPEPAITPSKIRAAVAKSEMKPVLWLDEVDKFHPTPGRLTYLLRLIDVVYAEGGTILSSANMTLDQLRVHLHDPIYRRLMGSNDPKAEYEIFDLHDLLARDRRAEKRLVKAKAA